MKKNFIVKYTYPNGFSRVDTKQVSLYDEDLETNLFTEEEHWSMTEATIKGYLFGLRSCGYHVVVTKSVEQDEITKKERTLTNPEIR